MDDDCLLLLLLLFLLLLATRAARCWNALIHDEDPSTRQSGPAHTAIVTRGPSALVGAASNGDAKLNAAATLQAEHNKIIHHNRDAARRKKRDDRSWINMVDENKK
jgi:hypothetical protein